MTVSREPSRVGAPSHRTPPAPRVSRPNSASSPSYARSKLDRKWPYLWTGRSLGLGTAEEVGSPRVPPTTPSPEPLGPSGPEMGPVKRGGLLVFREYLENRKGKKSQTLVVCRARRGLSNEPTPVPEGPRVRELRPAQRRAFFGSYLENPWLNIPQTLIDHSVGRGLSKEPTQLWPFNVGALGDRRSCRGRPRGPPPSCPSKGPRGTSPPEFELSGPSRCRDTGDFLLSS